MRLSRSASPAVDELFAGLARGLGADDPRRAASLDASQQWLATMLAADFSPAVATDPTGGVEGSAEAFVRHRLEVMADELMPAVNAVLPGREKAVHLRPLRSRLHAAVTLPVEDGALIFVDDAVVDLTMSTARWIAASFVSPVGSADGPTVPLYDGVRVLRAELGSVRWNGALWQPVKAGLPDESRAFAALLGELAVKFVLGHEMAHLALEHLSDQDGDDGAAREHEADVFAARILRRHVTEVSTDDPSEEAFLVALGRAGTEVALGLLDAVSSVFLVRGDDHPAARDRLEYALEGYGAEGESRVLERAVETFFVNLDELVLAGSPTLVELVESADGMQFAQPFDASELRELDAIDRIEGLFHSPLPSLLDALADLALPAGGIRPPPAVVAAANEADRINTDEGMGSLTTHRWVRLAAGRWWLFHQLSSQRNSDIKDTLFPGPGTRFCDWATWVEYDCPAEFQGIVLAVLHVYATVGMEVEGPALDGSGLLEAVAAWLSAGAGEGGGSG